MRCPVCLESESKVIDSRPSDDATSIRRRRECEKCQHRFSTYERVEETPIMVIKKDKTSQAFNREKILKGLIRACEKRPVTINQMEAAVSRIEQRIKNDLKKEVTAKELGEMVMNELKALDEVAYIRFASVYREFKDVKLFLKEINKLMRSEEQEND